MRFERIIEEWISIAAFAHKRSLPEDAVDRTAHHAITGNPNVCDVF